MAVTEGSPHALEEANRTVLGVGAVVLAHDGLDSLGGFVCMVEGNGGDVMMENVGLDDAMEELATNKAKFAVDGRSGATSKGPGMRVVVRKGRVSVLEVRDHDFSSSVPAHHFKC